MLLEAYRECMRDVFDMPAFLEILRAIANRQIRVHVVDSKTPSPFASSLLFSYVANYIYDGDAPLAERRAQALSIDQEQLRDLLGDADLRELLDADAIAEVEEQLQALTETARARSADGIHDLLLRLGDLSREELARRVASPDLLDHVTRLLRTRRMLEVKVANEKRLIAIEDAARYRDALGVSLPPGIPASLLASVTAPVLELARRYARTHGPFTLQEIAARFGLDTEQVEAALRFLLLDGRIIEEVFAPAAFIANGATPKSFVSSAKSHWHGYEKRSNQSSSKCSPVSRPIGKAFFSRAEALTPCSMPSTISRARRCLHLFWKATSSPHG